MKIEHIDYGQIIDIWLTAADGSAFAAELNIGDELKLWKDEQSEDFFIAGKKAVMRVYGRNNPDQRNLSELCFRNMPRICWMADVKNQPEESYCLIRCHQFPGMQINLSELDIALDDLSREQAGRVNPQILKNTSLLINWFEEQFIVTVPSDESQKWCFISIGDNDQSLERGEDKNNVQPALKCFFLHGKNYKISVSLSEKTTTEKKIDGVFFMVNRIIPKRSNNESVRYPIQLGYGKISFKLPQDASTVRTSVASELTRLVEADDSYIKAWDTYGDSETSHIILDARTIGSLEYNSYEFINDEKGQFIKFVLTAPVPEKSAPFINIGLPLDVSIKVPEIINNESMLWSDYYNEFILKGKKDYNCQVSGKIYSADPKAGIIIIGPIKINGELQLSNRGYLYHSVKGDFEMLIRRYATRDAIRTADCAMPHLGLLLEDAVDIPIPRHVWLEGITSSVKRKIFKNNPPTPRQCEAIDIAINTPDIALIQGPPGTGKTTVITAIIERLNELNKDIGKSSGSFLISGYQHEAVENAKERILVNELPPIKFGRSKDENYQEDLDWLEKWIIEKKNAIESKGFADPSGNIQQELDNIVKSYAISPGDIGHTCSLLQEAYDLVKNDIPHELLNEITGLIRTLREESGLQIDKNDREELISAVRAIRCTPTAFMDDGQWSAYKALYALKKVNAISRESESLLSAASEWPCEDGIPPFIKDLDVLRRDLLLKLTLTQNSSYRPKVREDVAALLSNLRETVEKRRKATKSGPEQIAAEFLYELETNPDEVKNAIIEYTVVFAATCQQSKGKQIEKIKKNTELLKFSSKNNFFDPANGKETDIFYDTVLIDEAARSTPLDLFIPMAQAKRRIILVGDHRQLPQLIDERIQKEIDSGLACSDDQTISKKIKEEIEKSLFERLFKQMQNREEIDKIKRTATLDEQYRMHPVLGAFVSREFYEIHGEGFKSPTPAEKFAHKLPGYEAKPAAWVEVPFSEGPEEKGKSKSRKVEARAIARELKRLIEDESSKNLTFGIITFYSEQKNKIDEALIEHEIMERDADGNVVIKNEFKYLTLSDGKVIDKLKVGTVDAFQGKEFDVVFLSMVRSNNFNDYDERSRRKKYGHLMSLNRLCVSMSRQKKILIVFGDSTMLRSPAAAIAIKPLIEYYELCKKTGVVK